MTVPIGYWDKAEFSDDADPHVIWRPVYSGQLGPDIVKRFLEAAESGEVVRLVARKRDVH